MPVKAWRYRYLFGQLCLGQELSFSSLQEVFLSTSDYEVLGYLLHKLLNRQNRYPSINDLNGKIYLLVQLHVCNKVNPIMSLHFWGENYFDNKQGSHPKKIVTCLLQEIKCWHRLNKALGSGMLWQ